jgi:hypothetical protein
MQLDVGLKPNLQLLGQGPTYLLPVAIDTARATLDQHCRTAQSTIRPDHDREPHL